MNIDISNINQTKNSQSVNKSSQVADSSVKFSEELKELEKKQETKVTNEEKIDLETEKSEDENKKVDEAIDDLNSIVKELNQSDEKIDENLKNQTTSTDNDKKGEILINKDFSIQENKDLLPQMNPNMNFSGDGQPFSSFMNNDQNQTNDRKLRSTAKDLAEESAILSTMAENIAIANRNNLLKEDALNENIKTLNKQDGVVKVNTKNNVAVENIVKFDSIIMNKADVEVFSQLVQNGQIDIKNLAPEAAKQSIQVSKTLADMIAKSMETNQPLRIDFDNNISVIIRISRDGKISADFLPSSQVAEAYLKENLPLLRQRFDDNNIKYDELNQRERRENREHNRKKGRDNE